VAQIVKLKQQPTAVVITGDLVDFGRADEYEFLRNLLASLPMPYYLIPGNHDDRDAMRAAFPEHTYLRQREATIEYAVDVGGLRLVAVDSVIPGASGGRVAEESLAWLDETLRAQPRQPTLILIHHPPFKTHIGHMDQIGLTNPQALAEVVKKYPQVERVLCGHLHRSISTRFAGTIASTCPGTSHQVVLDLSPEAPSRFVIEPPGFQLHVWEPNAGLVTHTAFIGDFDGPYPFYDSQGLID
jgi:3',5'-cyclic AMP phosphodiesterase CpdA